MEQSSRSDEQGRLLLHHLLRRRLGVPRNERFLQPVKIHEGACKEKNEADENEKSSTIMNPLADSTDAASCPAHADAASLTPPRRWR